MPRTKAVPCTTSVVLARMAAPYMLFDTVPPDDTRAADCPIAGRKLGGAGAGPGAARPAADATDGPALCVRAELLGEVLASEPHFRRLPLAARGLELVGERPAMLERG